MSKEHRPSHSPTHGRLDAHLFRVLKELQRSSVNPGFYDPQFQTDRVRSILASLLRDRLVPQMYLAKSEAISPMVHPLPDYDRPPKRATPPIEALGLLYINPNFIRFLSDKEIATLLLHEGFHVQHVQEIKRLTRALPDTKFGNMVARMVMRKHELDADSYASSITGGESNISLLIKFKMLNIANLNPEILKSQNSHIIRVTASKLMPDEMSLKERFWSFIDTFGKLHPSLPRRIANSIKYITPHAMP